MTETRTVSLLIDVAEVARLLCVSKRTVWRLLSAGKFPKPVRVGRSVRWNRGVLEGWISAGCPDTVKLNENQETERMTNG